MSKNRNLVADIQDEIQRGELSFRHIAQAFDVSYDDVMTIVQELQEQYAYEDDLI